MGTFAMGLLLLPRLGAQRALYANMFSLLSSFAAGGYYRPASYLLAKAALDGLLLRAIPVFIFSAALYPMVRGWSGWGPFVAGLRGCMRALC